MFLIIICLAVNILVAGYFGFLLSVNYSQKVTEKPYGISSPSSKILGSLYISIAGISLLALLFSHWTFTIAFVLFPLQIIYKILSVLFVKDLQNPVILSNIAIAILLLVTWIINFILI